VRVCCGLKVVGEKGKTTMPDPRILVTLLIPLPEKGSEDRREDERGEGGRDIDEANERSPLLRWGSACVFTS